MRRSTATTACIVIGLVCAAGAWGIHFPEPARHLGSDSIGAASSLEAASVGSPSAGRTRAFNFVRGIRARTGSSSALVDLSLRGKLFVRTGPATSLSSLIKIQEITSPEGKLATMPWIKIETKGSQTRFSSGPASGETSTAAARFAKDILDQYRFFDKSDLQGDYAASFTRIDELHFDKHKQKYLNEPYSTARIEASKHSLTLARDGLPEKIEGREAILLGNTELSVHSDSDYRIELAENEMDAFEEQTQPEWHEAQLEAPQVPGTRGLASDPRSLETAPSLDELLARLRAGGLTTGALKMAWFKDAAKRISTEPGKVDALRHALPDLKASPDQFSLLVGAMAASPQKDSGAILVEAYQDENYPDALRAQIMSAWTATEAPLPPETTAYLMGLASDQNTPPEQTQSALLALGAQAQKSPESSAEIQALLTAKLEQAQTEAEKIAALDAMGNAGIGAFLPSIQAYLANPSAHLRAHAYMALRFIPGTTIVALLQAGSADPSGEVQSSAQLSMELRDSES